MNNKTLLDLTKRLLKDSPLTLREISVGADVGYEWLSKFAQGRIDNPGVKTVQNLHDYLIRSIK